MANFGTGPVDIILHDIGSKGRLCYTDSKERTMIYTCTIDTLLGPVRAAAVDDALTGLWFEGQKYYPENAGTWIVRKDYPVFTHLREWLDRYFAGENPACTLPLAPAGTTFQQAVWKILQGIPYGKTSTYGSIAAQFAKEHKMSSMSAQAVGGAVGHNAVSLIIPCHRVVGSGGKLTGYAGGLDRKHRLLELERGRLGQD